MQDELEPMIEKYRHELMEYSKKYPRTMAEENIVMPASVPEDRILPNGSLYRSDFEDGEDVSVSAEEASAVEVAEYSETPAVETMAVSSRQTNAGENVVSMASEGNPPYNNGKVVEYNNIDSFLSGNSKTGYLRVQVSAAGRAFPVQNASVIVSKKFADKDSVFYEEHTDASGIMNRITLPAPDRNLSEAPGSLQPYSTYNIAVSHPGFVSTYFMNCVVFDGIETIQQVVLVPLLDDTEKQEMIVNEEGEN